MWKEAGDLHTGEAEALVLARRHKADWFLTDDSTARLFVSLLGMEVHGSLGVILWNAAHKHLSRSETEEALTGSLIMKEIADYLQAFYSTVSRVVKRVEAGMHHCKT